MVPRIFVSQVPDQWRGVESPPGEAGGPRRVRGRVSARRRRSRDASHHPLARTYVCTRRRGKMTDARRPAGGGNHPAGRPDAKRSSHWEPGDRPPRGATRTISGLIARSPSLAGWQHGTARVPSNILRPTRAPETRGRREQPVSRPPPLSRSRRTRRPTGGEVVSSSAPSVDEVERDAGKDSRCRNGSRSRHGGEQAGQQEADSSRHLRLLSRRPSAAAATSVQPPSADGPECPRPLAGGVLPKLLRAGLQPGNPALRAAL
jgi:hypothetical protein